MEMRDRIKLIRKQNNLTQSEFAVSLGLAPTSTTTWERKVNPQIPTDSMQLLICEKYGVNLKWLQTGKGAPFTSTLDDELSALAQAHGLDEMDVALIRTYIDLPKSAQAALKDFLLRLDANRRAAENRMPGEWAAELEQAQKSARPESEADAKSG